MVLLGLTAVAIGVVIKTALESQGVSSVKAELASEATKQVIDKAPKVIKEIVGEVEPYSERSPWENALDLQRMM
jgi:hypothetical protein